ncbi:type II toxin-antitoxin system RelE/ParE family toxin [Haemophilus haemolyticus]|uniref:type II toxin-antitoxin system RelE family toxin n=1 Tax=Haemophilus haemolyticus TaxID=726 RepID=UPI000E58E8DE
MTYKLTFSPKAKKEWNKLGDTIKSQFKKKLVERLENPYVPADRLSGFYRKALSIYNKITLPLYKVRCFYQLFFNSFKKATKIVFWGVVNSCQCLSNSSLFHSANSIQSAKK